jgi:uncharacterized membrane protein
MPLFSIFAFVVMLVLLPILFGELMAASLGKLHLSPGIALLLMVAIVIGGLINIPVKRITHERLVPMHPLAVFGLGRLWPEMARARRETVIAVNFGGCVVRTFLAAYQLLFLVAAGARTLLALLVAAGINIAVCYFIARSVPGVGILMPGLVPAAVAAILAVLCAPGDAAPVAYVAGVTGPLIGAGILHLREIEASAVGVASIGGAGTFDGIVLSGIVAAYRRDLRLARQPFSNLVPSDGYRE